VAIETHQKGPSGRLGLLIALLALVMSATFAFARVLQGTGPAFRLAGAAAVSLLLAAALERRHIVLATLVSAASLVLAIGWLVFPETLRHALPTLDTLRSARAAFADVGQAAAVQPAPALPLPPLFLAALTAVWTAAFSSHALAVRARSPFLAVIPPAALIAFAGPIMEDGARPGYVAPFLIAALGLLFADSLWRIGQWGPVTSWRGKKTSRSMAANTRAARRVAVACLGIALLAPGILPGFRAPGLVDVQGSQSGLRVSINPIVDIRPRLVDNPRVEVFTVRTGLGSTGAYWQITTADVFNGREWLTADPQASRGVTLPFGPTSLPGAAGATNSISSVVLHQHIQFRPGFFQPQLPNAFEPIDLNAPDEGIKWNPRSGLLFDGNARSGFSYDVTSQEPLPTPDQLDAVQSLASLQSDFYTRLPSDTPREVYQIAHRIADPEPDPYRKIVAIQNYLRQNFQYSLEVPAGHSTNDLLDFLTRRKAGYCEQFAGSMAVLLRALGIPARVAVGFTQGRFDPTDQLWHVTTQNAHTWVQVPFPGIGWLSFEPTPPRINPVGYSYDFPPSIVPPDVSVQCKELITVPKNGQTQKDFCEVANTPSTTNSGPGGGGHHNGVDTQVGGNTIPAPPISNRSSWPDPRTLGLIALLALLGLAVLAVPVVKSIRRRIRIARASAPSERVLAAFDVLAAQAADVGLGRRPYETVREYRARLKAQVISLDGDLDLLTALTANAAYSEHGVSRDQAQEAVAAAKRAGDDIVRAFGPLRRAAGWFRVDLSRR
jgi:hypothetical protein